jgi:hypothetical protein
MHPEAGERAVPLLVCGCEPRNFRQQLARFAVRRVALAPAAVLAQLESLRIVPLALIRLVVPALALFACESGGDPDVSTGHLSASRTGVDQDFGTGCGRVNERRRAPDSSVAIPRAPRARARGRAICLRAARSR